MLANDVTPERLRRLASHGGAGKVLSLFVNLDPSRFGTAPARATQIRSLLDRAGRAVAEERELSHAEREALKADLQRVERELENGPDLSGARGLAVYASSPAGLFEVLRLPAPVDHDPVVADTPCVEPVAALGHGERWAVLLVNRQFARLLHGSRDTLHEVALVESDVHGQHQQGGWSQARYQRSVDKDVADHLKDVADVTFRRLERELPSGILLGGPDETIAELKQALHPYLRERLAGRLSVDVEHSSLDDVRAAAARRIDAVARDREDALLARLKEGLGRGAGDARAAAGVADVLAALTEQRVETLLLDAGAGAPGVRCPQCGWLGASGEACPADGTATITRGDVLGDAVDRAIGQSARVVVLRDRPDLGPHEHVAAILRF
ncbi:MAG TPA: Vms1/Ankzf1 family peptidyl-tRNA hydrolase [Solirubrobacteraceae bacterium]|nr:Vms1/Ankzf1 family peptidyl-tRNA hydrolase [Solirubrobacteraceae bacterium]